MSPPPQQLASSKPYDRAAEPRDRFTAQSPLLILPTFLREETNLLSGKLLSLTLLGGLANGLLVAVVLAAVRTKSKDDNTFLLVGLFVVSLGLFAVSKVYIQDRTAVELEAITRRIRLRIADSIRKAELIDFEHVGPSRYYNVLTLELQTLVTTSRQFVSTISSAWLAIAGVLYIAFLSLGAAVATGVTLLFGVIQIYQGNRVLEQLIAESSSREGLFLDRLRDLRDGFKELKISAKKNDDLFENYIVRNALISEGVKLETNKVMTRHSVFAQCFVYVLLGTIVFVLPYILDLDAFKQGQIIAVLIFILNPIADIVSALQGAVRAGGAIFNIRQLEADLHRIKPVPRERQDPIETFGPFEQLDLVGTTFSYEPQEGGRAFGLKPTNLTVQRGDVIFIVGGNGSGKSTLIHLLCGLYLPQSGEIRVNGKLVDREDVTAFRALFGIVLQDYYLFDHIYGNSTVDLETAKELLKELDLHGKTSIRADGSIETLNLSGGQRKRLAMVLARLDDPQIFIFDEWAADQDPAYKKYFYKKLLPTLAKANKTAIVISHDERYFPTDTRNVYRMEEGVLLPYAPYNGNGNGDNGGNHKILPPSGK